MARGTRTPSQNAYRGSIGRTQTTMVHVTGPRGDLIAAQVHTTIDAVSDPELVERLHSEDPVKALQVRPFIESVSCNAPARRDQESDLVVVVKGTNGDMRHSRQLTHRVLIRAHRHSD